MNYRILPIIVLSLLTHYACSHTNFNLYNSLPCTLYYALCNTSSKSTHSSFIPIEPYTTIQAEIKTPQDIEFSVVKELPHAGQEIPLYKIIPTSESSVIDIKTYQTKKGEIRIIPQASSTTKEPMEGTKPISRHDIWITKTTFHPPQVVQEVLPPITSPAVPILMADSTSTDTANTVHEISQESAQQPIPNTQNCTLDTEQHPVDTAQTPTTFTASCTIATTNDQASEKNEVVE